MGALITGPLAEALESGREHFNAQFDHASRVAPRLNPEEFVGLLRRTLALVVEAAHRAQAERTGEVVEALYLLSLELLGKGLLGSNSKHPLIEEAWRRLLPAAPLLLAQWPTRFAGAITNAVYNLSSVQPGAAAKWIEHMERIGKECQTLDEYRHVGEVMAWRSGMAHYRAEALKLCAHLPDHLARLALGLPEGEGASRAVEILEEFRNDPWRQPAVVRHDAKKQRRLRTVAMLGAFRGFGGQFIAPPRVTVADGVFLACDAESCWTVHADVFGATLLRSGVEAPAPSKSSTGKFRIDPKGEVRIAEYREVFSILSGASSFAADEHTLAVTIPHSHSVYLVALVDVDYETKLP